MPDDELYSRGDENVTPTDDSNLETLFTGNDYIDVSTENNVYVVQSATEEYALFLFKDKNSNSTDIFEVTWKGKTNIAPSTEIVYLQVYNRNTTSWETLDSNSVVAANTKFTLTGSVLINLTDYYDVGNWVACRVYQEMT